MSTVATGHPNTVKVSKVMGFLLWQRWHGVSVISLGTPGCPLSPIVPSCFAFW